MSWFKGILFIGPPGSGKGTQATKLARDDGLCHLSTGDMLRAEVRAGSELGKKAEVYMKAGELLPNHLLVDVISEKLSSEECKNGYLLDGFPRTVDQAHSLNDLLERKGRPLTRVYCLECSDAVLTRRVCGRRIHKPSGRTYHVDFLPPKAPGKDDVTGESLIQRRDDNEETLKKRLSVYKEKTAPLKEFYSSINKLSVINAALPPNYVYAQIRSVGSFYETLAKAK